jgi:hypothetical protein
VWATVLIKAMSFVQQWLEEVGQQLEYRKNYDRYWTGELFMKQVSKPLPGLHYKHY